jgi:predicted DNA-binding transcriptional regulator YafY
MAINKDAFTRYKVLDKCFRNPGRKYFIEDLLEACNNALVEFNGNESGIKRRQLYDDIRFMKSEQGWSIPLKSIQDGKKKYYRYEDMNFSINNQPLNDAEAEQIRAALQVLSRFSGSVQFDWVNELLPKLETKFGLVKREKEVIGYESNVDAHGLEHITPLFDAINNFQVLLITYQDFRSPEPYEIILHPHYLKQYNNRWFLFGLNPERDNYPWNMALDRIQAISTSTEKYIPSTIDWEDYFYDIVGVTRLVDGELEKVSLLFSKRLAPYIITKPLHPSQKQEFTKEGLEVTIKVIPNYELEKLILSFGEDVSVITPADLREKIQDRIENASKNYT